jgi:putative addiction module component (TIGR02574 family)
MGSMNFQAMGLTNAQKTELDQRVSKYDSGKMKFKSWEETKKSIGILERDRSEKP